MTNRAALEECLRSGAGLGDAELEQAKQYSQSKGVPLERAVVALGHCDESRAWRCLAKASGLPFVDPGKAKLTDELVGRVPADQIEQNQALPVLVKDGVLFVAIDDPLKTWVADNFGFFVGGEVRCALAPPGRLKETIKRVLGGGAQAAPGGARGRSAAADSGDPDAPIIRLVEDMITRAVLERASDIHIEPYENKVRVRYRVDGVLRDQDTLEGSLHGPLTSRLKILAAMDIAERRKPQDGRIEFRADGRQIDIRTSVLPSNHGETIVMRLLDKEQGLKSLEALGFEGEDRERFAQTIKRPNGIVLVTGPTGSGKTTTLYAALQQLNRPDVKIITAEDPVEFNLAGINQCQVRSSIGLDFARILRAMLRQAPNIILVGEIRDHETAEIAVQAALTGHLVFSTLHTNDAPSAITRLTDMGVKPFLVSAAVQAVMAQRLLRVLCVECRTTSPATEAELRLLGLEDRSGEGLEVGRAVGCSTCEGSGYRGRVGIFEMMVLDRSIREAIFQGTSTEALRRLVRDSGHMRTLFQDGVRKVLAGVTSVEELLRVSASN